eukprot:14253309-Ditylum_brightwellii.AAC.1
MTTADNEKSIFFDEENKEDEYEEQDDDDGSLYDGSSGVADRDQKLSSAKGKLYLNPKPPPWPANYGTPRKTQVKVPFIQGKTTSPMTMPCSTSKSPGDLYSVASSSVHRDILQEYDVIDSESFVLQNRTKFNPFVTFVDCHHPERNGGMYWIDITLVHGIDFNGHSRDAFKIRLQILIMPPRKLLDVMQSVLMILRSKSGHTTFSSGLL